VRLGGNEKVELIAQVPLFEHCTKGELGEIASLADEIDLDKGKALMREGEIGHEFFVLLEGEADVTQGEELINHLGPGDFFGEIALISHGPRTATVTTTTAVRALVVTERSFHRLVEQHPQLQMKVLEAAVERLNPKLVRRGAQRQSAQQER
jgi:CRP/FNR family transcriptional regulator, cyclic AMP receptor protein